jgi:hypothetical protein
MITRYAFFQGSVKAGQTEDFRAFTLEKLVPVWRQFPGAQEVRVMFSEDRDEGAPEFPLILAISYPDRDAMALALNSEPRARSREITGEMVAQYFDGTIHHHVTVCNHFDT